MKLETAIVVTKGWCICTSAISSAVAAGLSQLPSNITSIFGVPMPVFGLVLNAYSVGMVSLLGFISSTFTDFMTKRTPTGNTQFLTNTATKP